MCIRVYAYACSTTLIIIDVLFVIGMVVSAKIISPKKLAVISFTIFNNVIMFFGVVLFLAGIAMGTSSMFRAAYDLKVQKYFLCTACFCCSCSYRLRVGGGAAVSGLPWVSALLCFAIATCLL